MIRTLLSAIILTVFSSISYGGSLDGKGVFCDSEKGYWFDKDLVSVHKIEGYKINIERQKYIEEGTKYAKWVGEVTWVSLDRRDLRVNMGFGTRHQCVMVRSNKEITDRLNVIIEDAKKKNKI